MKEYLKIGAIAVIAVAIVKMIARKSGNAALAEYLG